MNGTINLVQSLDFIGIKYTVTFAREDVDFRYASMFKTGKNSQKFALLQLSARGAVLTRWG